MSADTYLRVLVVEVFSLDKEKESHWKQYNELRDLMQQVQEVQNFFFDAWRAWHFKNGSAGKIRQFQQDWMDYKEYGSRRKPPELAVTQAHDVVLNESHRVASEKPSLETKAACPEFQKEVYAAVVRQWPQLHTRVVTLVLNKLSQLVMSTKSSKGSWPGWHSWLLFREQIPCFTNPCPLPFDKANSYLEPPKVHAGRTSDLTQDDSGSLVHAGANGESVHAGAPSERSFILHCVLAREEVPGKTRKSSITYHCTIRDQGKRMIGRKATLAKIAAGEYQFAGSQVFLKDKKLFAAIAYKQPKPAKLTGEKTAILRPSIKHPASMRMNGRSWWIGGDGKIAGVIRKQLMGQRWSRQESYRRCATSARKGHGRKRAIEKVTLLSNRWRDFVKTYNRNLAIEACKKAVANGCGVLIYVRPHKDSRFFSTVGRFDERDKSRWDWFGLEKTLSDKCVEFGLELICKDSGRNKVNAGFDVAEDQLQETGV